MSPFGLLTIFAASAGLGYLLALSRDRVNPGADARRISEIWARHPLQPIRIEFSSGLATAIACLFVSLFFTFISSTTNAPLAGALAVFSGIAYWLLIPLWVVRDAHSRGGRAWAWGVMTLFTNLLGLFSYLITRPEALRECRRCGFMLRKEFSICPYCGPDSGRSCESCQGMLDPDWRYCPFCQANATPVDPERMAVTT